MRILPIFKTIRFKVILTCVLFAIMVLIFTNFIVNFTITKLVEGFIANRLESDINYIEDIISGGESYNWSIKEHGIYFGDTLIGDGTEEKANFQPFLYMQEKTGTLSYVFMLDENEKLGYVKAGKNSLGYEQGHYLRVAGSTKGPNGESIVGTYITKNVADALDKYGVYQGEAVVSGKLIYTLYNTLTNEQGKIVGVIVVGRYIQEIKSQIAATIKYLLTMVIVVVSVCCIVIVVLMSGWLSVISDITGYIKRIEDGELPEEPLPVRANDELSLISDSINKMEASLRENAVLRKKAETDAVTGLPNRFAYEYYSGKLDKLNGRAKTLAVEILDIDFFKEYNDNYGHQLGDDCIIKVSNVIKELVDANKNIFACRYGGDEFVLIYKNYARAEVEGFLKCLHDTLDSYQIEHKYSNAGRVVTISQGACFGEFTQEYTVEDFLKTADEALYEVKNSSRASYMIIDMK